MGKTIKVNQYVEVSEWVDIEVDIDEVLQELSDDELSVELRNRAGEPVVEKFPKVEISRRSLCDAFGVGYHTKKEELKILAIELIDNFN